jgi:MoxR-like ATPase
MLEMLKSEHPLEKLQPVLTAEQLAICQRAVRTVHVDAKIRQYITEIVHATRAHHDIALGGSPRASIALYRTSQAIAAIRGRTFVDPDDVKSIVHAVLGHRVLLRPEARLQNVSVAEILTDILDNVKVPLLENRGAAPAAREA